MNVLAHYCHPRITCAKRYRYVQWIKEVLIALAQRQMPPADATIAVVTRREPQLDSFAERVCSAPAWAGQMDPALPKIQYVRTKYT